MQNLQVLLVEDDRSAALDVEMLLEEMGLTLASVKNNAAEALSYIYTEQPDLIIMDVELQGERSGFDVAKDIDHLGIPIIFTTSYKDKKSYEASKSLNSCGYLVKPFDKLSLQSLLEQAIKAFSLEPDINQSMQPVPAITVLPDKVLVKHVNTLYPVRFDEILFIQGEGNYCSIQTEGRKFILKMSLRKLFEALPLNEFSPVHKSFVVRLDKVDSIDIGSAKLAVGKDWLPLGRKFKSTFLDHFTMLK
jgi:DNA-binding LytR/AlgR family response regulator